MSHKFLNLIWSVFTACKKGKQVDEEKENEQCSSEGRWAAKDGAKCETQTQDTHSNANE